MRGTVATGVPFIRPRQQDANTPQAAGTPSDRLDPTLTYRLLVLYLAQRVDPEFKFADYVSDLAMPSVILARTECYPAILKSVLNAKLTSAQSFKKDTRAVRDVVFPYMMYPTLNFDRPVFVGTGTEDHDVSPKTDQYPLVKAACEAGSTMEHHYYSGLDHSGAVNTSLVDSVPFVMGQAIVSNCGSLQPPPAAENQ